MRERVDCRKIAMAEKFCMNRVCTRDDGPNHKRVVRYVCSKHRPYCDDCLGRCTTCRRVCKFCPVCDPAKHCVECDAKATRLCHECEMCNECLNKYVC